MTAADMVDWELAISVASRLAGPGPEVSRSEADAVVAELREDAARSTGLVREYTGLVAADAESGVAAPLLVVDRPGWIRANTESFDLLLTPFVDKVTAKKGPPSGFTKALGSRVTGAEIGAVLGFLGGKVLGQFDPFHAPLGPVAARRAQHRPRRARARRRPHRLPALGLPARGDPPRAVHGGAVDARPPLRADRPALRRHRADPAARRRPQGPLRGAQGRVQGEPARHPRLSRAARDHGPPHRRDVAPRGPRRRGDGRRRTQRHPVGQGHPQEVHPPPPGGRDARQVPAPRARSGRQDGAVPRRRRVRPRGRRQGRDGRLQRRLAGPRPPAHQGRDRRSSGLGAPRAG